MVERISDEMAIRTVQQSYFHSVDAKDWDRFGSLLAEDAVFDFSAAVDPTLPPVRGRMAVVEFVRSSMSALTSAHHGFLRELEFVGADRARALWAMEDILWRGEAAALSKYMHGYGHYRIEYKQLECGWNIVDWKLTRTFVEQF